MAISAPVAGAAHGAPAGVALHTTPLARDRPARSAHQSCRHRACPRPRRPACLEPAHRRGLAAQDLRRARAALAAHGDAGDPGRRRRHRRCQPDRFRPVALAAHASGSNWRCVWKRSGPGPSPSTSSSPRPTATRPRPTPRRSPSRRPSSPAPCAVLPDNDAVMAAALRRQKVVLGIAGVPQKLAARWAAQRRAGARHGSDR